MHFIVMKSVVPALTEDTIGDWLASFEKHSNTRFDSKIGRLWKFFLISNVKFELFDSEHFSHQYGLLLVYHHAIHDGVSTKLIFKEIQKMLNAGLAKGTLASTVSNDNILGSTYTYLESYTLKENIWKIILWIPLAKTLIRSIVEMFTN